MAEMTIRVNRQEIRVAEKVLYAWQILERAGLDPGEYELFAVSGQDSTRLEQGAQVKIEDGMRCNTILKSVPFG